jgi:hypothetical protein
MIKRDISVITGLLSVIVCMILGLTGDARPMTILFRTFVCFALSVILSLLVVTAVEKCTQRHSPSLQQEQSENSDQDDDTISKAS